jgi:hypothetical protein
VRYFVAGFEPIPVNARDANLLVIGVENLVSAGMPVTGPRRGQAIAAGKDSQRERSANHSNPYNVSKH